MERDTLVIKLLNTKEIDVVDPKGELLTAISKSQRCAANNYLKMHHIAMRRRPLKRIEIRTINVSDTAKYISEIAGQTTIRKAI